MKTCKTLSLILICAALVACGTAPPDEITPPSSVETSGSGGETSDQDSSAADSAETDSSNTSEQSESEAEPKTAAPETEASQEETVRQEASAGEEVPHTAEIPDLTGYWIQQGYKDRESYMYGTVSGSTIEIYWDMNVLGSALYWAGSYEAPVSADPYTWSSVNDKTRTDKSLFGSGDDTKMFAYSDDQISYEASAFGETGTIILIHISEEEYNSFVGTESEDSAESPATSDTITETVLVDEAGIKITAKSLDKSGWMGPELKLLIENNTDKNLTVQVRNASVNGYMVSTSISEDVAAGKKANGEITFSNTSLKGAGISTFADMEFSFHIVDDEWDTYLDTDMITVRTAAAETYTYSYDNSGDEIYNDNGIIVVAKGLNTGDIFGKGAVFYFHNGSDQPVTISDRDCSVNGFMLDPNLYVEIMPGKHAVDDMDFWSSELEENGITDIADIEFSLHISNNDTWDTIDDSDPIVLHFD